jgi:lipopolysaccharide heptosyltransferase I
MRILIIKLSSLGDLFHALPAVHNLKTETGATIDWVTNTAYVDLVRCFDDIETVIPFPRHSLRRDLGAFLRTLRQTHYDKIIDLQGLLKSALVARAARGSCRIGPSFQREGARLFYDSVAGTRDKNRHAVIENLDIIVHLGLRLDTPVFPVTLPESRLQVPSPHIAICPTSRWETKNWPAERFAAVARHLQTQCGATITLLGAPADQSACQAIADSLPKACNNLAGKTSIVEMGSILKAADLLISNDSGPVHMAAAVGTRTLVIFGPTNPGRTGPFGTGHRVLQSLNTCQPCMSRRCKHPDSSCIRNISADEVIAAAVGMI